MGVYVADMNLMVYINVAKYWKNGSPVILGDASKFSEAHSILLVKRQAAMCKVFC